MAPTRSGGLPGPGSRTACPGPRCSRSTPASRGRSRRPGRIPRSSRSGARGSVRYVVAAVDAAVFTLGRLPDDPAGLKRAESTADRLEAFLGGRTMSYADAGHGIGIDPNSLRHGAPTGRIRIRWEGARRPTIWTVPRPDVEPPEARRELARRYLTVLGPGTADTFAEWAGIRAPRAHRIFDDLAPELAAVRTPTGDGWILAADEPSFGRAASGTRPVGRAAPPERRRLVPALGRGPCAARAGRGPPRRAVDVARLARGDPRRRRDRRRLAASLGGRLAVDVANALARRARRRRRRGGVVAAARRRRHGSGSAGRAAPLDVAAWARYASRVRRTTGISRSVLSRSYRTPGPRRRSASRPPPARRRRGSRAGP